MPTGVAPIWSNPSFIAESRLRLRLGACLRELSIDGREKWLDIGCGTRPYAALFPAGVYVGVDVPESGRPNTMKLPNVYYDGHRLPFPDRAVDGVFSTQVLEHVASPDDFLEECRRVLKLGACLVLSAPFLWEEHEQPYDYFRFSSYGMRELLARHGFEVIALHKTAGTLETLAQSLSTYASGNLRLPIPGFGRLMAFLVCMPIQLAGFLLQRVLPDRGDLFLDCVVVARRKV